MIEILVNSPPKNNATAGQFEKTKGYIPNSRKQNMVRAMNSIERLD